MELLQLPFFCFLLTIFLTSLMVFRRKEYKPTSTGGGVNATSSSRRHVNLPGPSQLPLIGSIHHIARHVLPHRRLLELANRFGPVMLLRLGHVDHVIVSSPEAMEAVLKSQENSFPSKPQFITLKLQTYNYTNINFSPYGNYWRQLRKICMVELLTAKRVKQFYSLRQEEISSLVGEIAGSEGVAFNLSRRLVSMTNTIVFRAVMGKKCRHQEKFLAMMEEAILLVTGSQIVDLFPSWKFLSVVSGTKHKLERLFLCLDEVLDEIVKEHEAKLATKSGEEEEDMLDVLLRLKDGGKLELPLTMDNVKAVASELFGAGTDSSYTTIEWALAEMVRHPEMMARAQAEVRSALGGKTRLEESEVSGLKYLKLVIKESLRLHPPAPLIPRQCTEDCIVQGYTIPAGSRVLANIWAVGRDPNYWEDPDAFKPERFDESSINFKGTDFNYLPFGAGRRMCPGMTFALATVELCLANLLCWFDWELPDGMKPQELDMTEKFSAIVARKMELCMIPRIKIPLPVG